MEQPKLKLERFSGVLCLIALGFYFPRAASQVIEAPLPTITAAQFVQAFPAQDTPNKLIVDIVHRMPHGGGYSAKRDALNQLMRAVNISPATGTPWLTLTPGTAMPSFCSGATYLVFIELVNELSSLKQVRLSPKEWARLLVKGQPDGEGVWGRWNANGPGSARLFYELRLGKNFQSLSAAQPGDFLKLFWNDEIGVKEFGHSVIFLGTRATREGEVLHIWSSNLHVGYGGKDVPLSKVKRMLFSRFTNPSALQGIGELPERDTYLAGLVTRPSAADEMYAMVGIEKHEGK